MEIVAAPWRRAGRQNKVRGRAYPHALHGSAVTPYLLLKYNILDAAYTLPCFNNFFRTGTGETPSEYRKRKQKENVHVIAPKRMDG